MRLLFYVVPCVGLKSKRVFFFLECSTKLGLLTKEEVVAIRNGDDLDKVAMKMALALVSLCTNLNCVRSKPTKNAIDYLQCVTNGNYNVNKMIRKKARIIYESDDEDGEIVTNRVEIVDESAKKSNEYDIECSVVVAKDFDLDDFVEDIVQEGEGDLFSNLRVGEMDMIDELFNV